MKESKSIQFNNYLLENCPAYLKFQQILQRSGFQGVHENGFFCWHGTNDDAIKSICYEGFNPKFRGTAAGQRCGKGEYFGGTPQISMSYSQGCKHLILCYILNNATFTYRQNNIIVVDNPVDFKSTYCLPLLVITFGDGKPVNFLEKPLN